MRKPPSARFGSRLLFSLHLPLPTSCTRVCCEVTEDNALVVDYQAYAVDKNTVGNFTTHSFFNLSGNLGCEILDHIIYVNASRFLPIN